MPQWLQHALVLLIVALAVMFVARHALRALWGKASRIGSCCARGCDAGSQQAPTHQDAREADRAAPQRVVFFPVENLSKKR